MPDDLRLETNFEHNIIRKLNELSDSGWQISENDNGFDADTALYMDDFISYIMATAPQKIEKMKKDLGGSWKSNLKNGGALLYEVGAGQADSVSAILSENGFADICTWRDLCGIIRVVGGIKTENAG